MQRWEDMTREQRRRNGRIVTVLLALSTIISLAFLTFALVTKSNAEKAAIDYDLKVHTMEAELVNCKRQAEEANARAEKAQEEAIRQLGLGQQKN